MLKITWKILKLLLKEVNEILDDRNTKYDETTKYLYPHNLCKEKGSCSEKDLGLKKSLEKRRRRK